MAFANKIKFVIQKSLRSRGWELRRCEVSPMRKLVSFLAHSKIEQVLDVGANIGQYACELRSNGFDGRIISFEPQTDAHASLAALAKKDARWSIAPRVAIGEKSGVVEINVSQNSVSSSVLPIKKNHTDNAPNSRYVRKETVTVMRLDDCDLIDRNQQTFLKADTQGFEQQVLNGASGLLPHLAGIQLEISLAPLYEGQADFYDMLGQLMAAGFELWNINPAFEDTTTGRLLQADITLFRSI